MTGQEIINHFKTFKGRGRAWSAYGESLVVPVLIEGKKTSIEVNEHSQISYIVYGSPVKGVRQVLAQVHFTGKVTCGENALAKVELRQKEQAKQWNTK